MRPSTIETDYLIVGAGAGGLSFADTLLKETNADITLIDEREAPGGHWNNAYDFVRLHQPSAFYGVNSVPFDDDRIIEEGPDAGFHAMATGEEVRAYFGRVMNEILLTSGRVRYLPMCRHAGDGRIQSLKDGGSLDVRSRKLVDTTYVAGSTPQRHVPSYTIAPGVRHVPVNDLSSKADTAESYVIIGGGKTAMDACIWLLGRGTEPDRIQWIVPQDSWLLNRAQYQPGSRALADAMAGQLEAAAEAGSLDDLFLRMEEKGLVLRIDPGVKPTAYRCATVNLWELDQLRRVRNVIRLGRVRALERGRIELEQGEITSDPDALHVDCSAKGISPKPLRPIFEPGRITVQYVRGCGQPPFSAALIAAVEARLSDDDSKNAACQPVPGPESVADWPAMTIANLENGIGWTSRVELQDWVAEARLNIFRLSENHREERRRMRAALPKAMENLARLGR